jgi:hypothetical protein
LGFESNQTADCIENDFGKPLRNDGKFPVGVRKSSGTRRNDNYRPLRAQRAQRKTTKETGEESGFLAWFVTYYNLSGSHWNGRAAH